MVGYLDGVGECGERDRKISMQQSPAVLCIFNMEKAAGVAVATNPKSAQSAHPSVPHPPTTLAAASSPPPSPSSSLATSQQIESCDLRPAYLGEQGSGSDQGSCPKLHSRSQSRSMCQRILVRSRQSSLFSSLFVFILLLPFTLYSNPSEGDLYP